MPFSIAGPSGPALSSLDGINKATDRISSGQQVNYQNNAAEAAISGRLDTAIGESTIEIRNATSQISALQKADQTLGQATDIVERIQSLSVQAGNGALAESDKKVIANQSTSLIDEASQLLANAEFNGNDLFANTGIDIESLKSKLDEIRKAGIPADPDKLQSLQDDLTTAQAEIGAEQNTVISRIDNIASNRDISQSQRSDLSDSDFASEFASLIKAEIAFEANVKVFNHRRIAEESIVSLLSS